MRGREDDEMSHDDTEANKAHLTPEFQRIAFINRAYKAGMKGGINEFLDSLPEEKGKALRKKLKVRRPRKPKPEVQ